MPPSSRRLPARRAKTLTASRMLFCVPTPWHGGFHAGVAERLGSGLQSRLHGFESRHSLVVLIVFKAGRGGNHLVEPTVCADKALFWHNEYQRSFTTVADARRLVVRTVFIPERVLANMRCAAIKQLARSRRTSLRVSILRRYPGFACVPKRVAAHSSGDRSHKPGNGAFDVLREPSTRTMSNSNKPSTERLLRSRWARTHLASETVGSSPPASITYSGLLIKITGKMNTNDAQSVTSRPLPRASVRR